MYYSNSREQNIFIHRYDYFFIIFFGGGGVFRRCEHFVYDWPRGVVDRAVPVKPHHLIVGHHVEEAGALFVGEVQIGHPQAPHLGGVQLHAVEGALDGGELVGDQGVDPAKVEHHGDFEVL